MTNVAIIGNAKLLNGVTEDVDTFAGWKRRGRQVKKAAKPYLRQVSGSREASRKRTRNRARTMDQTECFLLLRRSLV